MELHSDTIATPLGEMYAVVIDGRLAILDFADDAAGVGAILERRFGPASRPTPGRLGDLRARLDAYFKGRADALDGLALDPGGSPFQQSVWAELRRIPYAETRSYAAVAKAIGRPGAARAVGTANRQNPIAIAIPCHRVIGKDGGLCGYAGGVERKRRLLALEAGRGL